MTKEDHDFLAWVLAVIIRLHSGLPLEKPDWLLVPGIRALEAE